MVSVEDKICLLLYTCTVPLNHIPIGSFSQSPPLIVSFPSCLFLIVSPITSSLHLPLVFSKTRMMRTRRLVFFFLWFALVLGSNFSLLSATSAITAALRDQVACTMCSSCDNPCQPIPSPPPPSPPLPSPPPPSSEPNCPPPPSPPSSGNYYYSPPPPPLPPSVPTVLYYSPPPPSSSGGGGGGEFYPPPTGNTFLAPPPPNPIVPYFPFYYYNPPPSASIISKSLPVAKHSIFSSAIFLLIVQFFIF